MSQDSFCTNCRNGKHHDNQDVEGCSCPCSNLVKGDHLISQSSDIRNSKVAGVS